MAKNDLFSLYSDRLRKPNDLVAGPRQSMRDLAPDPGEQELLLRRIRQLETVRPLVDYSDFANFVFFNSAYDYFNITGEKILNEYPYDGSRGLIQNFTDDLDDYQQYVLETWPSRVGHLRFQPAQGFAYVSVADFGNVRNPAGTSSGVSTMGGILSPGTGSLTVEFWCEVPPTLTGSNDAMVVVQKASGSGDGYTAFFTGSSFIFQMVSGSAGGPATTDSVTISLANVPTLSSPDTYFGCVWDNQVQGLLTVYTGSQTQFPVAVASAVLQITGPMMFSTGALTMGSGTLSGKTVRPLTGSLDEVRIWNVPRQLADLSGTFNVRAYSQSGSMSLIGLWHFNESGSSPSTFENSICLDSSGYRLNGVIQNYYPAIRNSGSLFNFDVPDPILYLDAPEVQALIAVQQASGTLYDKFNDNHIINLVPDDFLELEAGSMVLENWLYIYARELDQIKVRIDQFANVLKTSYGQFDQTPDALLEEVGRYFGWEFTGNFLNAGAVQYLLGKNVLGNIQANQELDQTLSEIKNQFMRRLLSNLIYIYKTKGTRESVESLMRVYGLGTSFVRLKEYGLKPNAGLSTHRINAEKSNQAAAFGTGSSSGSMTVYSQPVSSSFLSLEARVRFPLSTDPNISPTILTGALLTIGQVPPAIPPVYDQFPLNYYGTSQWYGLGTPVFDLSNYTGGSWVDSIAGTAGTIIGSPTASLSTPYYPAGFSGQNSLATGLSQTTGDGFNFGNVLTSVFTGTFTICALVRPISGSTGAVISKYSLGSGPFYIQFVTNDYFTFVNSAVINSPNVEVGAWHALCVSYQFVTPTTSVLRMNLDGFDVAPVTNAVGPLTASADSLIIGMIPGIATGFQGDVARLTIFNVAASQIQLKQAALAMLDEVSTNNQFIMNVTRTVSPAPTGSSITSPASSSQVYFLPQNVARVDNLGLLIEPSGSNFVPQSQALATTPWGATGNVANPTAINNTTDVLAPDGTQTATKITMPGVAAGGGNFSTVYQTLYLSGTYNVSAWFMAATGTAPVDFYMYFGVSSANRISFPITASAGWQRFSGGPLAMAGGGSEQLGIGVNQSFGGQGGALPTASFYVWGVQVESGSQVSGPTSYIPTTTGPASRSGELVAITNPFAGSAAPWSIGLTVTPLSGANWNHPTVDQILWEVCAGSGSSLAGTNDAYALFSHASNQIQFSVFDAASGQKSLNYLHKFATGSTHRLVFSDNSGTLQLYVDGQFASSSIAGTGTGCIATMPPFVCIANVDGGVDQPLPGHYSNIILAQSGSILAQLYWTKPAASSLTGTIGFTGSFGNVQIQNAPVFDEGWYNVAAVQSAVSGTITLSVREIDQTGDIDLYLTASLTASISSASLPVVLWAGATGTFPTQEFMHEVRMWNRTLQSGELDDHALNFQSYGTVTPISEYNDLVLRWPLAGNVDLLVTASVLDVSTNGNNGILSGNSVPYPYQNFTQTYNYIASPDLGWNEDKIRSFAASSVPPGDQFDEDRNVALEFNMIDALNEDISQMLSTLDSMNYAIGLPANRFRGTYQDIGALRKLYFKRLQGRLNFRLFADMLDFFDQSFVAMVRRLIPARANFLGEEFVVESHMLERPKLQWNYRRADVPFQPSGSISIYIRS